MCENLNNIQKNKRDNGWKEKLDALQDDIDNLFGNANNKRDDEKEDIDDKLDKLTKEYLKKDICKKKFNITLIRRVRRVTNYTLDFIPIDIQRIVYEYCKDDGSKVVEQLNTIINLIDEINSEGMQYAEGMQFENKLFGINLLYIMRFFKNIRKEIKKEKEKNQKFFSGIILECVLYFIIFLNIIPPIGINLITGVGFINLITEVSNGYVIFVSLSLICVSLISIFFEVCRMFIFVYLNKNDYLNFF